MANRVLSKFLTSGITVLLIGGNISPIFAATKSSKVLQAERKVKTAQTNYNNGAVKLLNSLTGKSSYNVESRISKAKNLSKSKSKKSDIKKYKTIYSYYSSHKKKVDKDLHDKTAPYTSTLDVKSNITFDTLRLQADFLDTTNAWRKKYGTSASRRRPIRLCAALMGDSYISAAMYQAEYMRTDKTDHWYLEAQYALSTMKYGRMYGTIYENLELGHIDPNDGWVKEERADYVKLQKVKAQIKKTKNKKTLKKLKKQKSSLEYSAGHYINVMRTFSGNGAAGFGIAEYAVGARYMSYKDLKQNIKSPKLYTASEWRKKVNACEKKYKTALDNAKSNLEKVKKEEAKKLVIDLSTTSYAYNGKEKSPSITVYNGTGTKLTKNKDYVIGTKVSVIETANDDSSEKDTTNDQASAVTENPATEPSGNEVGKITIRTGSAAKEYDGESLSYDNYSYNKDGLKEGDTLTVAMTGTQKEVGTSVNAASYKIMRGDEDVTSEYNIILEYGNLTVTVSSEATEVSAEDTTSEANAKITYAETKYTGNNVGAYTVTVTGIGDYAGQKATATFKIVPKGVSKPSVTAGKKKLTVKYKSPDGNKWNYQIAVKKKGGSWKYYKVSGLSKTFTKLSKKKTYYAKVRAYKNVGNTSYYGSWSKTASKMTK